MLLAILHVAFFFPLSGGNGKIAFMGGDRGTLRKMRMKLIKAKRVEDTVSTR